MLEDSYLSHWLVLLNWYIVGGWWRCYLSGLYQHICCFRFLNGVGLGFVLATVSVYIVEIATTDMRGFLGCFVQFLGSVGVLITFCVGAVLNWWQLALVHLGMVVPFVIAMWFVPESPRWDKQYKQRNLVNNFNKISVHQCVSFLKKRKQKMQYQVLKLFTNVNN